MVYNPSRIEDFDSTSSTIETQGHPSQASMRMPVAKPAMSDSLFRLLSGASVDGTLEILEEFVEHLAEAGVSRAPFNDQGRTPTLEWDLAVEAIVDCGSMEQAIGRALVVADQMNRGVVVSNEGVSPSPAQDEDPFFSFSVADSLPDFGDHSRYRSKLAKKVGRMLKPGRDIETAVAS
jgi:hypothetical protein